MSSFSTNLKRIMKQKGVSASELARYMGTHRNNALRLMHMVQYPTPMTIWKAAQALDVHPRKLDENWEE